MKFCQEEFNPTTMFWTCQVCGAESEAPGLRMCPYVPMAFADRNELAGAWAICKHRSPPIATITGRVAGCGCPGSPVEVFQCLHPSINEPVIKQGKPPCMDTMREKVPGFTGRTCRKCKASLQAITPETLPPPEPVPQGIGVVVTCHNYGRYLRECLDSILDQTVRPEAMVLVDDASTDDTSTIAAEYTQRGVRYERVEFRDVAKARNHGAALCGKLAYFCFIDADDILPANYLEKLRAGMTDQRCAVTYPQCERFDGQRIIGMSPWIVPFDRGKLSRSNFACATSLVRRQALEQVDGWKSYRWGLHDWDLWLRIVQAGWTMRFVPDVALRYRMHGESMSQARYGKHECATEVMSASQLTAVVTLFSGRSWMLERWFESLTATDWNHDNLHLVAVDNSRDPEFASRLRAKLDRWRHTYIREDRRVDESVPTELAARGPEFRRANTYAMGVHLARLYSLAGRYIPASASHVWSVEDDVTFRPDALRTLATALLPRKAGAVSGCLRSRFANRTIAWDGRKSVTGPPDKPIIVDKTGFFCLLLRREAWESIAWRPGTTGTNKLPYYDWAACQDIGTVGPIYLTGDVRCRHWQADGGVLDV